MLLLPRIFTLPLDDAAMPITLMLHAAMPLTLLELLPRLHCCLLLTRCRRLMLPPLRCLI